MDPLNSLFSKGQLVHYQKGEIIVSPEKSTPGVDLIRQGFVRVYSLIGHKKQRSHIIYKAGEIYPLIQTLKESPKNLYYQAMNYVIVSRIPKDRFLQQITKKPKLALELIKLLANRLELYRDRVDNLAIKKSAPKIVARLLFFADRFGTQSGSNIQISVPLTQANIADSIAIARETVSRELQRLENKGIIIYRNNVITIRDKDRLLAEMSAYSQKSSKKEVASTNDTSQIQSILLSFTALHLYISEALSSLPTLI